MHASHGRRWARVLAGLAVMGASVVAMGATAGAATVTRTPGEAGYVASSATHVTTFAMGLTVPTVTCPSGSDDVVASTVVLLDPVSGDKVEAGSEVACTGGTADYEDGFAQVTDNAGTAASTSVPVGAGTHLQFTVTQSASKGTVGIVVDDTTSHTSHKATAPLAPAFTSISVLTSVSAPGDTGVAVPLPAFTAVTFGTVTVDGSPLGTLTPTEDELYDGQTLLVAASAVSAAGSFTVTFKRAEPTTSGFTVTASGTPRQVVVYGATPAVVTIAVDNTGTATSGAPVVVSDDVPAALTTIAGSPACGSVPAGVTCGVSASGATLTWTVGAGVPAGDTVDLSFAAYATTTDSAGVVTETATWTGPGCTTSPTCTTDTVTTDISTMVVSAAVAPPGSVVAGEDLTYTLTAAYTSPAGTASTGTLTISDTVPAETTLVAGSPSCGALSTTSTPACTVQFDSATDTVTWTVGPGIAADGSVAVTFSVKVDSDVPTGTTITDSASWNYTGE